jgi:hypothetical protein
MVGLGEKLGGGPTDRSAGVLEIVLGALFLRSNRIRPTLLGQRERLPRTGIVRRKHMSAYVDWHGKHTCCVYQVFHYKVYIDSNAATLGYE